MWWPSIVAARLTTHDQAGPPQRGLVHAASDLPRVLVVGHGPPTTGGIPSFLIRLTRDARMREAVHLEFMNTVPAGSKLPGAFTSSNVGRTAQHAWRIFRRARHVDVVHLNLAATPFLPLVRAFALCVGAAAAGSRVLLHTHTGQLESCLRDRAFRILLRQTLRVVDRLAVVSRSSESAVRDTVGSLSEKVLLIENGVPVAVHDPTSPLSVDRRVSSLASGRRPLLVFVGTVCERKGLLDLRDALCMLSDGASRPLPVRVAIVGSGEQEGPGAFERVKQAYSSRGLAEVDFLGALPQERVQEILAEADIFCLPSHWEGTPLALLEAMAAGAAVIATAVGDVPRLLEGGRAGIVVEPRDVDALALAIGRLAADAGERARLGVVATLRAKGEYGWDRTVSALIDLYAALAEMGARHPFR